MVYVFLMFSAPVNGYHDDEATTPDELLEAPDVCVPPPILESPSFLGPASISSIVSLGGM